MSFLKKVLLQKLYKPAIWDIDFRRLALKHVGAYYISSVYLPSNSNFDARTYYTFIYTYRKVLQRTEANLGLIKNIFEVDIIMNS